MRNHNRSLVASDLIQPVQIAIHRMTGPDTGRTVARKVQVAVTILHAGPFLPYKGNERAGVVAVVGHADEVVPLAVGNPFGVICQSEDVEECFVPREGVEFLGTTQPITEVGLAVQVSPVQSLGERLGAYLDGVAEATRSRNRVHHLDTPDTRLSKPQAGQSCDGSSVIHIGTTSPFEGQAIGTAVAAFGA